MEIDPFLSAYYRGRSAKSIAEELSVHGFDGVQYIVTRDSRFDRELLDALQRKGMHVDYATFGNGTYDTSDLPEGWQQWRMVTRQPLNDGYTRLCLNHLGYRRWKKAQMVRMLREHPFDGLHIMEPYWPEYPGPDSPAYGCLCEGCKRLFHQQYGAEAPLEFMESEHPRYWRKQPDLYRKWVHFRAASHTAFLNDLVNGQGGIRHMHPRAVVTVWVLAIDTEDPVAFVREVHGQDIAEVAQKVRPDQICLQTHWPDWIKANLPPTYVQAYKPLVEAVRAVRKDIPLMVQADIGSQPQNRQSWNWISLFRQACQQIGVKNSTLYEYVLGMYMYTEPPQIKRVFRQDGSKVLLVFNKRLHPVVADQPHKFLFSPPVQVLAVEVDGNLVTLRTSPLQRGRRYRLTVRDIADDPSNRWLPNTPANTLKHQTVFV